MEAKKTKFDAAEYDLEFLERMWEMGYEALLAYLQTLPEEERNMMEEAIDQAASHRAVQDHKDLLRSWL